MYCPNCGQQQVSEEMRFCSRCGLALSGLADWLAGGLPVQRANETLAATPSPRRKGVRRAAKFLFFSLASFPVFLAISLLIDEGAVLIFPCIFFFISLVIFLYARLFGETSAPVNVQTSAVGTFSARASLPSPVTAAIPNIGRQRVRTNELAQPPSVTENTTRLLDNE